MGNYTRTNGANARSNSWDDLFEDQMESTGSWLPLDALAGEDGKSGKVMRPVPQQGGAYTSAHGAEVSRAGTTRPGAAPGNAARSTGHTARLGGPTRAVALIAGAALCAVAAYVAVSAALQWTQVKLDDLQYGRPRTTQLDAFVGHGEGEGVPTHFVALNLNRRVSIIEMPGGDAAKATTIVGPYLFGEGEDLTPVLATVQDVNLDGAPDLIVSIKNEQLLYLNDGQAFNLITPEEKAALQKSMNVPATEPATGKAPVEEAGK